MSNKRKGRRLRSATQREDADERRLKERLREAREALRRIRSGNAPTAAELAVAPQLDFWIVVRDPPCLVLRGIVTGHPTLKDGAMIATSPLLWLADDQTAARTVSRFYRLGLPLEALAAHLQ